MNTNTIANGMSFVNDENVIGKWEHFANIKTIDEFNCQKPICFLDKGFKEIYFLPNGEKYWIFEGWTKGFLLIHYGGDEPILCYKYTIENKNNDSFLFIEITDNEPFICVLRKVSNKHYKLIEIGHRDNIDLPFVIDETILGEWKAVSFVNKINDFDEAVISSDDLWLKSIYFYENGIAVRIYGDETWTDCWTKGYLLDKNKSTASAYELKPIKGVDYLFMEWKMGNYVYGGFEPNYYVFKRV